MQIIAQKFSNAVLLSNKDNEAMHEPGLVLFITTDTTDSPSTYEKAAHKIASLRLWNNWSENLIHGSKRVILAPKGNVDVSCLFEHFKKIGCNPELYREEDYITFTNDGPCTMIHYF